MFNNTNGDNIKLIDVQINNKLLELENPETDVSYADRIKDIERLVALRDTLSGNRSRESLLPVMVSGSLNLIGILIVLNYEKRDVITSKAFSMIPKVFKRGV